MENNDTRESTPAPSPDRVGRSYKLDSATQALLTKQLHNRALRSLRYRIRKWIYNSPEFERSDAEYLVGYYWPVIRVEWEHNQFFLKRQLDRHPTNAELAAETADRIVKGFEDSDKNLNFLKKSNAYGFSIWAILGSILLRIILEWLFKKLIDRWETEGQRANLDST